MKAYTTSEYLSVSDIDKNFPTTMVIPSGKEVTITENTTAYGFASQDGGTLVSNGKTFNLHKGMYFCVPGSTQIKNLAGLVCMRKNYRGMFTIGGPVEKLGRLKYIDGCSDTLLISPSLFGEPCLNYLYVPMNVNQTAHTHPSVRVGYVLEGDGYCLHETGKFDLVKDTIFLLKPEEIHSFHTTTNYLKIVVFHPDSDFGPSHEIHPMINKTYVNGESLRGVNQYRTTIIR